MLSPLEWISSVPSYVNVLISISAAVMKSSKFCTKNKSKRVQYTFNINYINIGFNSKFKNLWGFFSTDRKYSIQTFLFLVSGLLHLLQYSVFLWFFLNDMTVWLINSLLYCMCLRLCKCVFLYVHMNAFVYLNNYIIWGLW